MPELTPYDTGQRCEPKVWPAYLSDPDRYGRVDFDNDEGGTVLTAYVESTPEGYRLVVEPFFDADGIEVSIVQ